MYLQLQLALHQRRRFVTKVTQSPKTMMTYVQGLNAVRILILKIRLNELLGVKRNLSFQFLNVLPTWSGTTVTPDAKNLATIRNATVAKGVFPVVSVPRGKYVTVINASNKTNVPIEYVKVSVTRKW